jgi:hypothetical protein
MEYLKKKHRFLVHFPVLPFIYFAAVPIVLLDFWVELYHRVSFPIYGIPCIKRSRYVRIDRHRLKYLNFMQKMNCAYCGYANGLVHYWMKIFGTTEKYWCAIQHEKAGDFVPPGHHGEFVAYNDREGLQKEYLDHKTRMF